MFTTPFVYFRMCLSLQTLSNSTIYTFKIYDSVDNQGSFESSSLDIFSHCFWSLGLMVKLFCQILLSISNDICMTLLEDIDEDPPDLYKVSSSIIQWPNRGSWLSSPCIGNTFNVSMNLHQPPPDHHHSSACMHDMHCTSSMLDSYMVKPAFYEFYFCKNHTSVLLPYH